MFEGMKLVTEDEFRSVVDFKWSMTYSYDLDENGKYRGLKVCYGTLAPNGIVNPQAMCYRHIDEHGLLTKSCIFFVSSSVELVEEAL